MRRNRVVGGTLSVHRDRRGRCYPPLGTNEIETLAFWVGESPNPTVHPAPVAGSAGQGYFAASTDPSFPILSAPAAGGPTVPFTITNVAETFPLLPTTSRFGIGFAQLTSSGLPPTVIVGWPAAALHSEKAPAAPGVNPLPVMVTVVPLRRQVAGLTVTVTPTDVAVAGARMHPESVAADVDGEAALDSSVELADVQLLAPPPTIASMPTTSNIRRNAFPRSSWQWIRRAKPQVIRRPRYTNRLGEVNIY